jgi:hypothetical protein
VGVRHPRSRGPSKMSLFHEESEVWKNFRPCAWLFALPLRFCLAYHRLPIIHGSLTTHYPTSTHSLPTVIAAAGKALSTDLPRSTGRGSNLHRIPSFLPTPGARVSRQPQGIDSCIMQLERDLSSIRAIWRSSIGGRGRNCEEVSKKQNLSSSSVATAQLPVSLLSSEHGVARRREAINAMNTRIPHCVEENEPIPAQDCDRN